MKLEMKLENNWLEATWLEDETQIHCESFSGHKEHITMLRAKALDFGTSLDEYDYLIKECEDSFIYPTDEEIAKEELQHKIAEAKAYLLSTDFYMTVDKYTELDEARKVELTTKRAEARELINTLEAELITLQGVK